MAKQTCEKCAGTGEIPCQGCGGMAKVYEESRREKGQWEKEEWSACAKCHGKGVVTCPKCKGTGEV